jgi:parallel beta-helix repeat protein
VNAGTPARLYVGSDYSIQVQNRNGSVIYSAPDGASDRFSSAQISFLQAGSGAVVRTAQAKMRDVVSVKDFGAVGDGVADDTVAINEAITYVNSLGGGVVTFPDGGTYMVNATGNLTGIQMKSGVYLDLTGAKLKATNANSANYRLVYFEQVSDCGIIGGEIDGDRASNTSGGDQGHCVYIILNCVDVVIQNVKAYNAIGDGIYTGRLCTGTKILNCVLTNNGRNNISVVSSSNVIIDGCDISNANGNLPEAGIDVEPNPGDAVSNNVVITNCHIYDNGREGVSFPAPAPTPLIETAIVSNCHIYNNGTQGIRASYVKNLEVSGCVIYGNGAGGIYDTAALATSLTFDGNLIFGNTGSGIEGFASGTIISNNVIRNNTAWGVKWQFGQHVTISGNTISDHGEDGIFYERAYNSSIIGNTVKNSQKHGIFITGTSVSSVTRSRASVISANTVFASSLLTDNTYSGIYLDANANTCTVNGNSIERAASGNQPLHAIYAEDASVIIVGNMTNNGAKSGNSQVRRAAVQPASFFNSPDFLANVTAEKFFPGLQFSAFITAGAGSPEGVQSAAVGSIWMRTDGGAGTTLYVKESGTSNTGWVAK